MVSKTFSLRDSGILSVLQSLRRALANSSGSLTFILEISPFSPYSMSRYLVMKEKSLLTLSCPPPSSTVTVNSESRPSERSLSPYIVSKPSLYESFISEADIVASSSIVGREFIISIIFLKSNLTPLESFTINDSVLSRTPSSSRSIRTSSRSFRTSTSLLFTSLTSLSSSTVSVYLSPTATAILCIVA